MKKFLILGLLSIGFCGCKNTSEEVKSISVEGSNSDTISVVSNDIVSAETAPLSQSAEVEDKKADITIEKKLPEANYASFGKKFTPEKALTPSQMLSKYKTLKSGDTIAVKFKSSIKEVCKKKGCWMSMAMPSEQESFVRFTDYGFFVPLNADGSEAIVSGRAYVDIITVAEQQHYAKDGGKSQDEIEKITEPKVTYAFQADGVLIKE